MKNGDKKRVFNWLRITNEIFFSSNQILSIFHDQDELSSRYLYHWKNSYYTEFNKGIIMILSSARPNNKNIRVQVVIQPNNSARVIELPTKGNEDLEIRKLIEKHINNY